MDLVFFICNIRFLWDYKLKNKDDPTYFTGLLRRFKMFPVKFPSHIQAYTAAVYYVKIQLLFTGALLTNLLQGLALNKYLVNSKLCL